MNHSAEAVYEQVCGTLAECERSESSAPASNLLKALGGIDVQRPSAYFLDYCVYKDSAGNTVTVSEKWHDPSGPYQNFPDIHRVRVTLQVLGKRPVEEMIEYEN